MSDPRNLVYEPDPRGLAEARERVSTYYSKKGARVPPERIFFTSGTSEAYAHLFRLLCDPEERVLAPRPSYPLLAYLAGLNDVRLGHYRLLYEFDEWRIGPEIEIGLDETTRAVITVQPNNPTGNFSPDRDRDILAGICEATGKALISDEVFLDYAWDGAGRPSLAADGRVLTFALGGISKLLGLPQMKLGWIAVSGPGPLVEDACRRLEMIADTFLSVSTPAQRAFLSWMDGYEALTGPILERVKANRLRLKEALDGAEGLRLLAAEGGWYGVVELQTGAGEDKALALLEQDRVLVQPAYFYDFDRDNGFVVSLLPEPVVFAEALGRILSRVW